jgi:hypothetical protein
MILLLNMIACYLMASYEALMEVLLDHSLQHRDLHQEPRRQCCSLLTSGNIRVRNSDSFVPEIMMIEVMYES